MCNFGLGKATVVPPDSEQAFSTRWCGGWLVLLLIVSPSENLIILGQVLDSFYS